MKTETASNELLRAYGDPMWRLRNLYSIKPEGDGLAIPFAPRPEQVEVLSSLLERPDEPLYIIKSRRLGMSTAIGLLMADCAAWGDGFQGSLVEQSQQDAERKMAEIMRLPSDFLLFPTDVEAARVVSSVRTPNDPKSGGKGRM